MYKPFYVALKLRPEAKKRVDQFSLAESQLEILPGYGTLEINENMGKVNYTYTNWRTGYCIEYSDGLKTEFSKLEPNSSLSLEKHRDDKIEPAKVLGRLSASIRAIDNSLNTYPDDNIDYSDYGIVNIEIDENGSVGKLFSRTSSGIRASQRAMWTVESLEWKPAYKNGAPIKDTYKYFIVDF